MANTKLTEISNFLRLDGRHTVDENYSDSIVNSIYDILINNIINEEYLENVLYRWAAIKFEISGDKLNTKKYYLIAIDKDDDTAMAKYANLLKRSNQIDLARKYYLMAIDKENTYAMNKYAALLINLKEIEEAKKYYQMAIDKGALYTICNYAILLSEQNEIDEAKKYYLMSINNNDTCGLKLFTKFIKNGVEEYCILVQLTSEIAKKRVDELLKLDEVINFIGTQQFMEFI
jgi:tetratricopeptide (TPR) repeat protein